MSLFYQENLATRGSAVNSIRLTHQTPLKKPNVSKTEGNEEENVKISGFSLNQPAALQGFPATVSNLSAFYTSSSQEPRDFLAKSKEIAYESKPVRTVSYINVPIYEKTEESAVKFEENSMELPCFRDYLRLRLLLREKDNELHVWRAKAEELARESSAKPQENAEKSQEFKETRENTESSKVLLAENQLLRRELEAAQRKVEEMTQKLSVFQGKLEEHEDLLQFEREKVKKAGVSRADGESSAAFSSKFKEMQEKLEIFRRESEDKELKLERVSQENAEILRKCEELLQKNRVLEQQRANFEEENARIVKENLQFGELRLVITGLKEEFRRNLKDKRQENQEKIDALRVLVDRCEEIERICGRR